MLDAVGVETGFRVQYGGSWTFGPVGATLEGWISGDLVASWRPMHVWAQVAMGGEIAIKAGPLSIGVALEASVTVEAPRPYLVEADLSVAIDLPAPLKDLDFDVHLEWSSPAPPQLVDPVLQQVGVESPIATAAWQAAVVETESGVDPTVSDASLPVVPLDGKVILVFDRPMNDLAVAASGELTEDVVGDYSMRYDLVEVSLERMPRAVRSGGVWEAVPLDDSSWVAQPDGKSTRLQIGVRSPFEYTRSTSRALRDSILATNASWPCLSETAPAEVCVDWEGYTVGSTVAAVSTNDGLGVVAAANLSVVTGTLGLPVLRVALQDPGFIAFVPPAPCRTVRIVIDAKTSPGTLTARAWSRGVEKASANIGGPGDFVFTHPGIDEITLDGTTIDARVARVCWLTESDALRGDAVTRHESRLEAATEAWSHDEKVFQPESWYRVKVVTRATLMRDGEVEGAPVETTRWAFFRTAGAPDDLRPYARRTVPEEAGELYRSYDPGVEWDTTYIEAMYGGDLDVVVVDANDVEVATLANAWGRAPEATVSETELAYAARLEACTSTSIEIESDQALHATASQLLSYAGFTSLSGFDAPVDTGAPASAWLASSGALVQGSATPQTVLPAGDVSWSDVMVEATVQSSAGKVGVVARWTDAANHLRLSVDASGARELISVVGGVSSTLWSGTGGHPVAAFRLVLRCEGTRLRGQLDDELLFDIPDGSAPASGKVGLYTANSSTASFSALRVAEAPGAWLSSRLGYRADVRGTWLLYSDAFTATGAPGWALTGAWSVSSGSLHAPSTMTPASHADESALAEIGRSDWQDVRVEVQVAVGALSGVVLRRSATGHVLVEIDAGSGEVVVGKRAAAGITELGRASIGTGTTFDLAVTAEAERIGVEISGEEVLVVVDPAPADGHVALCSTGVSSTFSSFAVRSWPRTTVLSWPFTSSRYAGFAELVDAFGAVYAETVSPTGDLAAALAGGATFEDLYGMFAGLADYRPAPPQLEISELLDASGVRHALLLESPEPIDSERLELAFMAGSVDVTAEVSVVWSRDRTKALLFRGSSFADGAYEVAMVYALDTDEPLQRAGSVAPEAARLTLELV